MIVCDLLFCFELCGRCTCLVNKFRRIMLELRWPVNGRFVCRESVVHETSWEMPCALLMYSGAHTVHHGGFCFYLSRVCNMQIARKCVAQRVFCIQNQVESGAQALAFDGSGQCLFVGCRNGRIHVLKVQNLEEGTFTFKFSVQTAQGCLSCMTFAQDSRERVAMSEYCHCDFKVVGIQCIFSSGLLVPAHLCIDATWTYGMTRPS